MLRRFSDQEAALWFIFSSVLAVQSLASFGFTPSFARLLAYARAGAEVEQMRDLRQGNAIGQGETNWRSIERLCTCMRRVFAVVSLVAMGLMLTVGTAVMWRPLAEQGHQLPSWIAWGAIVLVSTASLWGNYYLACLQGMDHVAETRRWETLVSVAGILTGFVVLLAGGRLLALILSNQLWALAGVLVNRGLCRRVHGGSFARLPRLAWDSGVFTVIWQSAWKNGLTGVLTLGLIQATGIIQAQSGNATATATYVFTLRIVTLLGQLSQAPFLSKLPELARLRAAGDTVKLFSLLRRGMLLAHWSLVGGLVVLPLVAPPVLTWLKSRSVEFDPVLWGLFSLNLFFERWSGMLQQVRNLTNRPLEHYGMFGYFGVNLTVLLLTHDALEMYAFPVAMLAAQLLFAIWLGSVAAYRTLRVKPLNFERGLALPAFAVLALSSFWLLLRPHS